MMKVLMFGWEFPPHISGGLGTACYGLTKSLAGFSDIELTFVVPRKFGDEDQSNLCLLSAGDIPVIEKQLHFEDGESKIRYFELNSELIPYLGTSEFEQLDSKKALEKNRFIETTPEGKIIFSGDYGVNLFEEIQNYAHVAETLAKKLDFDVIHVHDWMTFPAGMAAQRISGKPLVVHIHSTEFDRSGQHVNSGICNLEKEGLNAASVVVAVSHLTRNILIRNYHTDPHKVITVYNAVDPLDSAVQSRTKEVDRKKTVTFLGRITMQKGPEYFLETAFRVLQKTTQVRFILAGKGDLRDAMIKRAAELNISGYLDFPGFVPDKDVPQLLADSDVFVMPSVSEPFGLVALEAMQVGLPVIISKQSGVAEILKNAVSLDYWDVQGMSVALLDLLNNPDRSSRLGKLGKREVAGYLWKQSAAQIRQVYQSLINDSKLL